MRRGLLLAGLGLLSVIAVGGWVRRATPAPQPAVTQPAMNFNNEAATPAATPAPAAQTAQEPARVQPVVARRTVRRYQGSRVVVRKRSWKKSAAIIGGSAAGGAAIGALAGGGKGAAIGALAGGAAGTVYDRATHKKTVVVPQ